MPMGQYPYPQWGWWHHCLWVSKPGLEGGAGREVCVCVCVCELKCERGCVFKCEFVPNVVLDRYIFAPCVVLGHTQHTTRQAREGWGQT